MHTMKQSFVEWRNNMLNFEEELEKFKPSLEVEQAEDVIYNNNLTDISDILKELINEKEEN